MELVVYTSNPTQHWHWCEPVIKNWLIHARVYTDLEDEKIGIKIAQISQLGVQNVSRLHPMCSPEILHWDSGCLLSAGQASWILDEISDVGEGTQRLSVYMVLNLSILFCPQWHKNSINA